MGKIEGPRLGGDRGKRNKPKIIRISSEVLKCLFKSVLGFGCPGGPTHSSLVI